MINFYWVNEWMNDFLICSEVLSNSLTSLEVLSFRNFEQWLFGTLPLERSPDSLLYKVASFFLWFSPLLPSWLIFLLPLHDFSILTHGNSLSGSHLSPSLKNIICSKTFGRISVAMTHWPTLLTLDFHISTVHLFLLAVLPKILFKVKSIMIHPCPITQELNYS